MKHTFKELEELGQAKTAAQQVLINARCRNLYEQTLGWLMEVTPKKSHASIKSTLGAVIQIAAKAGADDGMVPSLTLTSGWRTKTMDEPKSTKAGDLWDPYAFHASWRIRDCQRVLSLATGASLEELYKGCSIDEYSFPVLDYWAYVSPNRKQPDLFDVWIEAGDDSLLFERSDALTEPEAVKALQQLFLKMLQSDRAGVKYLEALLKKQGVDTDE